MAKNHESLSFTYTEEMKKPCIEADLVPTLIPLLESTDQEMLLHAGRAIGHICYDNSKYWLERIPFSLAVRHYFIRHCNLQFIIILRPEHMRYLSLHLGIQFTQLTDTRLNASQTPPELWVSPIFLTSRWRILCQNCSATTRVAETHTYLNFAELPWAQILNGFAFFQSNNSIYKAKHLVKKCVRKNTLYKIIIKKNTEIFIYIYLCKEWYSPRYLCSRFFHKASTLACLLVSWIKPFSFTSPNSLRFFFTFNSQNDQKYLLYTGGNTELFTPAPSIHFPLPSTYLLLSF